MLRGVAATLVVVFTGIATNNRIVSVGVTDSGRRSKENVNDSGRHTGDRGGLIAEAAVAVLGIEAGIHHFGDVGSERPGDVDLGPLVSDYPNLQVGDVDVAVDVEDSTVVVGEDGDVAPRRAVLCEHKGGSGKE